MAEAPEPLAWDPRPAAEIETWARGLAAFGLEPDQGVGCPLEEVLGTDEATHPLLRAARRALRGEMVELETRQGDITFSSTFSPMTDGKGRIMGVVGLAVNISGRKRAELALARSEVLNSPARDG